MKVLKNTTDLKSVFSNKFTPETIEVADNYFETISTVKRFSFLDYPLFLNKTECKTCGHVAKDYFEAECISSGNCLNCEHVICNIQDAHAYDNEFTEDFII